MDNVGVLPSTTGTFSVAGETLYVMTEALGSLVNEMVAEAVVPSDVVPKTVGQLLEAKEFGTKVADEARRERIMTRMGLPYTDGVGLLSDAVLTDVPNLLTPDHLSGYTLAKLKDDLSLQEVYGPASGSTVVGETVFRNLQAQLLRDLYWVRKAPGPECDTHLRF